MIALFYFGTFCCNCLTVFSGRKYAKNTQTLNDLAIFNLITGIMATAIFYVTSGFKIQLNTRTCIYALIFALVIFINNSLCIAVFKYMGVAESVFIRQGLSLAVSISMGVLLYKEKFTLVSFLQIALIFLTFLAIFLPALKNKTTVKTITFTGLVICILTSVLSAFCTVITKSFAIDTEVTDETSFFFMTNVFMILTALTLVITLNKGSVNNSLKSFKTVPTAEYFTIFLNVFASNMGSLLSMAILKKDALLLYVPLSNALNLLAGETVSIFIAKEKPKIIAMILALLSILVVLFF